MRPSRAYIVRGAKDVQNWKKGVLLVMLKKLKGHDRQIKGQTGQYVIVSLSCDSLLRVVLQSGYIFKNYIAALF